MIQPTVAILAFSPIRRDARVLRQIAYLSEHFRLVVIGYGSLENVPSGVEYHAIAPPDGLGLGRKVRSAFYLPLGRCFPAWGYEAWYWQRSDRQAMLDLLKETQAHLIHANDWHSLPIGARAAQTSQAQLILDLHEYAPLQYPSRSYRGLLFNPLSDYLIRKYSRQVTATITVSHSIAEKYQQVYGLHPQVVMNAPPYNPTVRFTPTDEQHIRLVHHGAAIPARRLDLLIQTLGQTEPRYTLHFLLTNPTSAYVSRLQRLAERLAPGRVFFHPAVKPQEIVSRIAEFDLGFYLLPPTCFNQAAALPNKFFDFIAAGLAVCIGPSLEMARLVDQHKFGVVASSFDPGDAARLLNSLTTKNIDQMKCNALEAREFLNAEVEMSKLVDLYASLGL
mgnify:CR=1 FL=1